MPKYQYETVVKMTWAALIALFALIYFTGRNSAAMPTTVQVEGEVVVTHTVETTPKLPVYQLDVENSMCLYQTIAGEARNQPISGQIKVAEVIFNRLDHGYWGDTVCEVVKYVKDGTYHFTAWDPKDPNRAHMEQMFADDNYSLSTITAIHVGLQVMDHGVRFLPRDSYNYATAKTENYWTRKLEFVEQDGDHVFRRGF